MKTPSSPDSPMNWHLTETDGLWSVGLTTSAPGHYAASETEASAWVISGRMIPPGATDQEVRSIIQNKMASQRRPDGSEWEDYERVLAATRSASTLVREAAQSGAGWVGNFESRIRDLEKFFGPSDRWTTSYPSGGGGEYAGWAHTEEVEMPPPDELERYWSERQPEGAAPTKAYRKVEIRLERGGYDPITECNFGSNPKFFYRRWVE